jgi:hypothetical protein
MGKGNVRLVPNKALDRNKWNSCVSRSYNGLIYAYDWFLDICAEGWDALVMDDYAAVMPLPVIERFGMRFLYQPPLCVQLGVFSTTSFSDRHLDTFLNTIPNDYRYVNINLNKYNYTETKRFQVNEQRTCEIDLIRPYKKLYAGYHPQIKQILSGAANEPIRVDRDIKFAQFAGPFEKSLKQHKNNRRELSSQLHQIFSQLTIKKNGELWAARTRGKDTRGKDICASALFARSNQKTILLASSISGKNGLLGLTAIIDHYIKTNSEKNITLDFRLADSRETLNYFQGFGAAENRFLNLRKNQLPWYYKLFIKK